MYYKIAILRDAGGFQSIYEAVSIIEYKGILSSTGESRGHYICDVKDFNSKLWFRTDDECDPIQVHISAVSKLGYVVLFKRINACNK